MKNADLMLLLADKVEQRPSEEHDMRGWYFVEDCHTVSCAIGLAATLPEFKAIGLELVPTDNQGLWPYYEGRYGFQAIKALFDISLSDANRLFSALCYPTLNPNRETVASRLRNYVMTHSVEHIGTPEA